MALARRALSGLAVVRRLGLALVCAWGLPLHAERPSLADPVFERVGSQGDISDDVVSALAMDPRGLLWIGTADGLVRYDGREFRTLSWAQNMQGPRGTAFVRSLMAASDGRIWVGTDRDGLAGYDPETLQWRYFRPADGLGRGTVRVIAEDPLGRLWAGSFGVGLQRVDPRTGRIERFGLEQGLPDLRVPSLLVEPDGTVWAGTWNGLARLSPDSGRFVRVDLGASDPVINALHRDADGRLWVGTDKGDLLRLGLGDLGVEWINRAETPAGAVQGFVDMEGGELWVGRAAGLEIRRRSDGTLQRRLVQRLSQPWGLSGSDVRSLLRDRSGLLWLGSYGGGLQRHYPGTQALWVRQAERDEDGVLGVVDVRSLTEVQVGQRREIWFGTNARGVAVVDDNLRLIAALRATPGGYPGGRAGGMTVRAQGTAQPEVWVASDAGVSVFDAVSRRWLRNHALGQGRVRALRATQAGEVLAATQDGAYRWQAATGRFERLTLAEGAPLVGDVNALAEEADGTRWVGGERGLYRLAPGAQHLEPFEGKPDRKLQDPNVLGLLVDGQGRLWVDTSVGLHLRLPDGSFDWVSQRLGQGGKAFGANLLGDRKGRVWTHRGVYDPSSGTYDEIGTADGVNIGTGWFRSLTALSDGRLLYGGSKGVLVVDPERFWPWRFAAPLRVTELRINGSLVPLQRLSPSLQLAPGEESFTLRYAALDLSQPNRNRYRYRLEGRDADWVDAGGPLVSYGGLPPGEYTLVLDGSNRNGRWADEPLRIRIEVLPTWWQHWWSKALAVVLSLALAAAWTQWRTRSLRQRRQELELRVQERTQALEALSQELAEKGRALAESALVDPLTGLHNRRFLTQRIEEDLALALRRHEDAQRLGGEPAEDADLCFFLIDMDHFKEVNDVYGHAAGDAVLLQMRERLLEVFRASDYLVRWGGEEFLVVARGGTRRFAARLAERARQAVVQRPFELPGGQSLTRSCSIGFACYPLSRPHPRAASWSSVLALADSALYAAKRAGRDRWDGIIDADALDEAALTGRLGEDGRLDPRLHRLRGP